MKEQFTIVVADDDVDDQQLISEGLRDCRLAVEVVPVFDGLQLLDFLHRRYAYKAVKALPDLVLVDLNMPLMDGFTVLSEIRKNQKFDKMPVYVVTTSRSKADKEKALSLGANGFYSKGSSSKDVRKIMLEICYDCFEAPKGERQENAAG